MRIERSFTTEDAILYLSIDTDAAARCSMCTYLVEYSGLLSFAGIIALLLSGLLGYPALKKWYSSAEIRDADRIFFPLRKLAAETRVRQQASIPSPLLQKSEVVKSHKRAPFDGAMFGLKPYVRFAVWHHDWFRRRVGLPHQSLEWPKGVLQEQMVDFSWQSVQRHLSTKAPPELDEEKMQRLSIQLLVGGSILQLAGLSLWC